MLEVLAKCSDYREQHLHEYMSEFIRKKLKMLSLVGSRKTLLSVVFVIMTKINLLTYSLFQRTKKLIFDNSS